MLDQLPTAALGATSGGLDNNTTVILATMVIGIITTALGLWKTSSDQKHAIAMFQAQHDAQTRDREQTATEARKERLEIAAADKAEREEKARQLVEVLRLETEAVRARVEAQSASVRDRVDSSAKDVREKLEQTVRQAKADADRVVQAARTDASATLDAQTARMLEAIHAAAAANGVKADAAYSEANSVNLKIEKLHQHNTLQATAINKLLDVVKEQQIKLAAGIVDKPLPVEVVNVPLVTTVEPAKVEHGPA